MNENIKKFLKKVSGDAEIAAKFSAIKDPDEAYKMASSLQDGFSKEEFVSAMDKLAAVASSGDISDEDLLKYSGGGTTELIVSLGTSAMSGVATVYAFTSAAI